LHQGCFIFARKFNNNLIDDESNQFHAT